MTYNELTPAITTASSSSYSHSGAYGGGAVDAHSSSPLPCETHAAAHKESLRLSLLVKTIAISLLHLRKMVLPPVQIPRNYKKMRMLKVAGHDVPFTRKMWDRQKRAMCPRRYRLSSIPEARACQ